MPATTTPARREYRVLATFRNAALIPPFATLHTRKREAIAHAREIARWNFRDRADRTPRRVSVYVIDPGKRPSLLFQCHVSRKTGRIVSEVL